MTSDEGIIGVKFGGWNVDEGSGFSENFGSLLIDL